MRNIEGGCSRIWLWESGLDVLRNGLATGDLGIEERRSNFEGHNALLLVWLVMQGVRLEEYFGRHGGDAR